jgi:hypothetical protein
MAITSMPPGLATIWARGATRLLAVVKGHQTIAGLQPPRCHGRLTRETSVVIIVAP